MKSLSRRITESMGDEKITPIRIKGTKDGSIGNVHFLAEHILYPEGDPADIPEDGDVTEKWRLYINIGDQKPTNHH